MNNDELKKACALKLPVVHDGIEYPCIDEIIIKRKEMRSSFGEAVAPGLVCVVKLQDRCGNSFTYACPKDVKQKDGCYENI
jgi:hypothetical protein